MTAVLMKTASGGDEWLYERKLDVYGAR